MRICYLGEYPDEVVYNTVNIIKRYLRKNLVRLSGMHKDGGRITLPLDTTIRSLFFGVVIYRIQQCLADYYTI